MEVLKGVLKHFLTDPTSLRGRVGVCEFVALTATDVTEFILALVSRCLGSSTLKTFVVVNCSTFADSYSFIHSIISCFTMRSLLSSVMWGFSPTCNTFMVPLQVFSRWSRNRGFGHIQELLRTCADTWMVEALRPPCRLGKCGHRSSFD